MACRCQQCGCNYKVDFIVSDDLWDKIKPKNKSKGGGLLCGKCIVEHIEQLNNYAAYSIK